MSQKLLRRVLTAYESGDFRSLALVMEDVRLAVAKPEMVPLSDDQVMELIAELSPFTLHDFARSVERAHGIQKKEVT